jgi:hypothetical protein
MGSRRFISESDGRWGLGEKFVTGKRLVVIPRRPGRNENSIGVTVYPRDEREERDRLADTRMTATELVGKLRPEGPGIRPVSQDQVKRIRESLAAGVPQIYPVLVDRHGHVLDGKHRLAADPGWRTATVRAAGDDVAALAVARAANMGQPLPPKVAILIDRVLGDSRKVREVTRERIREALAEYPADSHNKIAGRVGVSHPTVNAVCAEEVERLSTSCTHGLTGRGARTDRKSSAGQPSDGSTRQGRQEELNRRKAETDRQAHPLFEAGLGQAGHRRPPGFGEAVSTAYHERDWGTLGYESWDAYVEGEFAGQLPKLSRDERRQFVAELREAGLSTRAIGSVAGISKDTVNRDLAGVSTETGAVSDAPSPVVTGDDEPHRKVDSQLARRLSSCPASGGPCSRRTSRRPRMAGQTTTPDGSR